ncbi:unnamed protein product [Orchesella dallaii]|uniref:EGF-like domain-containing protein n=1 Tax=Orchesella dallaii TaxID=48710 RepID=A0ABP1QVK0_9HEXA
MWKIFLAYPKSREISAQYVKSIFILLFLFHKFFTGTHAFENGKGVECSSNSQCDQGRYLECDGHTCTCRSNLGMIWEDNLGKCMIMAGAPCSRKGIQGAECVTNSSCIAGVCECDDEFLQNGFGSCELSYGAVCSDAEKCAIRYLLECSYSLNYQQQRTCQCKGDGIEYVWDEQKRKCVSTAGGRCELDDESANGDDKLECIANSECVEPGVCRCKPGFKQTPEGKCLLKFGEKCNDSQGLVCNYKYEHLICQERVCGCEFYGQQAFQPEIQICRWLVGEDCDVTEDNGLSENHPAESFPRKRMCVKDAVCEPSRPGGRRGTCVCNKGFEISSDKTCTKDRGYGHQCSASMDCDKKRYLECVPDEEQGSRCDCIQYEMYFDGKQCRVLPGKSCRQNKLCTHQSYCEGDWCVCNEGYKIGTSGCVPISRHSHSIELPTYPELRCEELLFGVGRSKCECLLKTKSHEWSSDKTACLALVGNECLSDGDCTDHANCDPDGQTCQCSLAAHTTTNRTCVLKSTASKDFGNSEQSGDWTERMHKLKSIHIDENSNEASNGGLQLVLSFKIIAFVVFTYSAIAIF